MKEKVVWLRDPREVVYKPERWDYLEKLRELAGKLGEALGPGGHVHGSLARGDVTKSSDIDIILTGGAQSYELELRLEEAGYRWQKRELVMATPNATPKGHLHVAENVTVTFPLAGFRPQEEAFYKFGGMLAAIGIESAGRVPGVNKKLLLIIPNDKGHTESSIIGREAETARLLGIPPDTVTERVRVLSRRDSVGRTGVYMREEVADGESFESALKQLTDRDPVIRRTMRERS